MSRYKVSGYQRYTYDPQTQVDKCLECEKSVAECNVCAANPKAKHRVRLDEKIIELWWQGLQDCQIAEVLGCTIVKVSRIRKRHDLQPNYQRRSGKLDAKKVYELWESGKKDGEIAEILDCHKETVRKTRVKLGLPPQCRRNKNET